MKKFLGLVVLMLFATLAPAEAQTGIMNPSTLTFNGVNTNADATPLADLSGYQVRIAGPFPAVTPQPPAPAYSPTVYSVKKVIPSASPTGTTALITFGTPGSFRLTEDLGLTQDGQYYGFVTAVDLTLNESGVQPVAFPFGRNRVAPATPTGTQVVQ